jgi:carbonic anhydrase
MRLFEAIISENHRVAAGRAPADLSGPEFDASLPIVALTCIDPRLNRLLPGALGIPEASFIWLRNAGNIITSPLSSTMRSLALACVVKGGKEIAVIGHTDCLVCKATVLDLVNRFQALGVDRSRLPENLTEYFGLFASERQNVLKAVEHIRFSPLTGQCVPVHGLLIDIGSGLLDWVVNGYEAPAMAVSKEVSGSLQNTLGTLADFVLGEMKFPDTKIGQIAQTVESYLRSQTEEPPKSSIENPAKKNEAGLLPKIPPTIVSLARHVQKAYGKKDGKN